MKIHFLRQPATGQEIREMMEALETYIKLAVDVEQGVVAGGGEYHADCEEVLLEEGSRQKIFAARTGILGREEWSLWH